MSDSCSHTLGTTLGQDSGRTLVLPLAAILTARSRFAGSAAPPVAMGLEDAIAWLDRAVAAEPAVTHVEIGGEGDPLAEFDLTMAVVAEIRQRYPGLVIALRTLGVGCADCAGQLAAAGISAVRLLVNAVDLIHLEKIYAWIRPGRKTLKLAEAGAILLNEQQKAGPALAAAGISFTVHTVVYPGLNDEHIGQIARTMAANGAKGMSLAACRAEPAADVVLGSPSAATMAAAVAAGRAHLPVTEITGEEEEGAAPPATLLPLPSKQRPNVAVVSSNGMTVDLHLGQADRMLIYGPRADGLVCLLASRPAPASGVNGNRWLNLAASLPDCFALIAASAGDNPRKVLAEQGIKVFISEDTIDGLVDALYGGGKKGKGCRK